MFFLIIYLVITKVYCLPCVSLISASTLKDWRSCNKQFLFMIERTIIKPKEVIVVISNSINELNTTLNKNKSTTISLYYRKGKHNQADNRNYGIDCSTCQIITIFDIDDFLSKYAIQEVIKIFTTIPDVDMTLHTYVEQRAMLDTEEFDVNNITQYIFPYNYSFIYSEYYKHRNSKVKHCCYYFDKDLPIHNAWLSVKREILLKNKYDADWKWYRSEDSELERRLILKHYNLLLMSYPFGHYMQKACVLCSDGTKFDPIGFAVVAVFYLIILFSGIFAARLNKSGSSDDMVLAGRNLSGFKGVLTMIATWVCGGYLYGTTQGVVTKGTGLAWTQAPWCYAVCFFVGALVFAKKMREAEYVTMMDPLKKKFGRVMNSLLYLPTVLGDVFWIGMGLATLGAALSTVIGITPEIAIIVSGAFAAIYTFIGGLYAVAFADVIQLAMMLFCLYLAVPFVLTSDRVSNPSFTKDIWQGSIAAEDAGLWLDSAILMILGGIPWQVYFQRILACRTVKDAKILSYLSGFGAFIAAIPAAIIGVWGTTVNWTVIPEVGSLDGKESYALSYILQYCTPKVITYLSIGGIAAATMSTADGALLASSTVFCYNIYRPLFHRNASDKEMIWVTRIGVFVICIVGCILAIISDDVYSLWVLSSDFIFVLLFPQLLLVLYYPRVNTYGSFVAFVVGLFLRIGGGEPTIKLPALIDFGKLPFRLIAMLSSLILMIIVSEITRYIVVTKGNTNWDFINYYSNNSENEAEEGNNQSLKTKQVELPKLESPSDKNNSINRNSDLDDDNTSCVIDPQIMEERHAMTEQMKIQHKMQLKRGIKV